MKIDLNARENTNYEKSYVAFLDVLGFKNLVFTNTDEAKKFAELSRDMADLIAGESFKKSGGCSH